MSNSLCLVQLILSSTYVFCFLMCVTYMLWKNKCKFNKRTKVVIAILSISMSLQMASTLNTYISELKTGYCNINQLSYSLLAQ